MSKDEKASANPRANAKRMRFVEGEVSAPTQPRVKAQRRTYSSGVEPEVEAVKQAKE